MKHTTGPWWYDGSYVREEATDATVARVCDDNGHLYMRARRPMPSVANARLIAAAPELLEALVMVRDADEDCRLDGLPTIPPSARAKIDAAIAKATGEAA